MAEVRYKRALESIAVKIRDLAIARAPKDTGALKRAIYSANTPAKTKMIKTTKNLKKISISLDYAPDAAPYGEFFNDPPKVIKRKALEKTARKRGNWNYAVNAINDKALDNEFRDLLDTLGDYVVNEVEYELSKF
jgi:hypothetical protein